MKVSVLIRALEGMFYNCRNKTLHLTFYETLNTNASRRPGTRQEFDENLPETYYIASVSANKRVLSVMRRECGDDREQDYAIAKVEGFDFYELAKSGVTDFTVHEYRELFPFTKNSSTTDETGVYKRYEECLKFDATLYVDLFKLMGETVSLTIESRGKLYLGHYIDNKVIIVETSDWAMNVKVTDFYSLNHFLPEYEVVDFVPYPSNMGVSKYLKKLQQAAEAGGLQFIEG